VDLFLEPVGVGFENNIGVELVFILRLKLASLVMVQEVLDDPVANPCRGRTFCVLETFHVLFFPGRL